MNLKDLVRNLQIEMNKQGESLSLDGDFGPKTQSALDKFDLTLNLSKKPIIPAVLDDAFIRSPWLRYLAPLIGLSEYMFKLNDILAPHWPQVGLPQFKDLKGRDHAWCSLAADWAMFKAGIKGTANAMALSWRTWGKECPYWFGSVLGIRHASGGGHVTFFLYWVDESKRLAACLGGNQGDEVNVTVYNLSGNKAGKDEVVNGPRWPIGFPDGSILGPSAVKAIIASVPKQSGSTT